MTDLPEVRFTFVDGVAIARIAGCMSAKQVIAAITGALTAARRQGHGRLLVDVTEASGFAVPSLALRVEMIREWALAAAHEVDVAMVCRPEFIDPQKFGIAVAHGFGLNANVFAEESSALDWLRTLA